MIMWSVVKKYLVMVQKKVERKNKDINLEQNYDFTGSQIKQQRRFVSMQIWMSHRWVSVAKKKFFFY